MENKTTNEYGYSRLTHDNRRHFVQKVVEEHVKRRQRSLIDDKCSNVVFALFEEAQQRDKRYVNKSVFEVVEQATVKTFFTGGADELLTDKMHKLTRDARLHTTSRSPPKKILQPLECQ